LGFQWEPVLRDDVQRVLSHPLPNLVNWQPKRRRIRSVGDLPAYWRRQIA
jgi:hypothetical protein